MFHTFSNKLPLLDCVSAFVLPFTDCKSSSNVETCLIRSNNSIPFILDCSLSILMYLLLNKNKLILVIFWCKLNSNFFIG